MNLDVPLDDLIKKDKQSRRKEGGGRNRNNNRNNNNNNNNRSAPYKKKFNRNNNNNNSGNSDGAWRHDLYDSGNAKAFLGKRSAKVDGFKVNITNLHFEVMENDLKDLFSPIGEVLLVKLKYDRSGRSDGRATIIFRNKRDALDAVEKYDGASLDGKPPIKLTFVEKAGGANNNNNNNNNSLANFNITISGLSNDKGRNVLVNNNNNGGGFRRNKQGGNRNRSNNRGGGNRNVTSGDLDRELDDYNSNRN